MMSRSGKRAQSCMQAASRARQRPRLSVAAALAARRGGLQPPAGADPGQQDGSYGSGHLPHLMGRHQAPTESSRGSGRQSGRGERLRALVQPTDVLCRRQKAVYGHCSADAGPLSTAPLATRCMETRVAPSGPPIQI